MLLKKQREKKRKALPELDMSQFLGLIGTPIR